MFDQIALWRDETFETCSMKSYSFGYFCEEHVWEVVPAVGLATARGLQTVPSQLNLSTSAVV